MEKEIHDHDHLSCGCGHCHEQSECKNENVKRESLFKIFSFDVAKIIFSILLFVAAEIVDNGVASLVLYACAAVAVGYELIVGFVKNIIHGEIFDENTLMLIASVTAFIIGYYSEGALIVLLFSIGEMLEGIATYNSKRKIAGLSEIKSAVVHLIDKDGSKDVAPESVTVGSLIQIKKGERVPIDGVLLAGNAEFDTKAVTGESKPYIVSGGESVYSGSINTGETVVIKTTKLYKDSTVEQIISMVEGSLAKKSSTQKFITSFAKVYTPIVAVLAVCVAVIPPLFDQMNFYKWIYKALSFLVISCPCALVISVPLAFFVGIGALAKNGILVKGSSYIDSLAKVDTVVFDKTGTITKGNMTVKQLKNIGQLSDDYVKTVLYAVESKSTHPISRAIVYAYKEFKVKAEGMELSSVNEVAGRGIAAETEGDKILIGNIKMMQENGVKVSEIVYDETVVYLAVNGVVCAAVLLGDEVKEESAYSLSALRNVGANRLFMLSGDNKVTAEKIGNAVGLDKVYAELLPNEKLDEFNRIKKECDGSVCYVGDGINDTPTLAAADVGVSMGGLGSEIAIESSDVVIMDDNLKKLPISIRHSKKIRSTVIQNIVCSLAVKFSVMFLSLVLSVPVWISMFADVGVMILAVLNSLKVSFVKKI